MDTLYSSGLIEFLNVDNQMVLDGILAVEDRDEIARLS